MVITVSIIAPIKSHAENPNEIIWDSNFIPLDIIDNTVKEDQILIIKPTASFFSEEITNLIINGVIRFEVTSETIKFQNLNIIIALFI